MSDMAQQEYAYLDYAATAPLCEEAAQALEPYLAVGDCGVAYGANPNSLHSAGRRAFEELEHARKGMAECLGASRPAEIVFTAGATESDNAALLGLAQAALDQRKRAGKPCAGHVIVSAIEHEAVLEPARRLQALGVRVSYVQPNAQGFVTPEALEQLMDDETLLVSVMLANSEVGAIQPVVQLAQTAHAHGALFHTDATQALGKMPVHVQELGVDAASFSGHKLGAPKGIGALYLKARTPFQAYLLGGGQEEGRRSGTQNVAGAVAFAAAAKAACERLPQEMKRLAELRDYLYGQLTAIPGVSATVSMEPGCSDYLCNIVHVLVAGFESETLVLRLDRAGFAVSGGSACASHSLEPSHVLRAIGIPSDKAYGALRVSMGRYTTREQVEAFVPALRQVIGA